MRYPSLKEHRALKGTREGLRVDAEFSASHERLRLLLNALPFIVCFLAPDGTTLFVNSALQKIAGYTPKEVQGRNWWHLFYPGDNYRQVVALFRKLEERFEVQDYEMALTAKNRNERVISWNFTNRYDEQGTLVEIMGLGIDLTERKQTEETLRKSEKRYKKQFEEAMDAIFIADAETGIIVDCNRVASDLVGREKSELVGKHQRILHPPEQIEGEFSRTFKQHLKEKEGQVLETQVITKKGEIKDVAIKANIFDLEGQKMILGIFHDITERKRAEARLRRLATIVIDSNDAITVQDLDGTLTAWNRGAERMYGYSEEEALGMNIVEMVPEEKRAEANGLIAQIRSGNLVESLETQRLTKDGRTLDEWLTISPLTDEQGNIVAIATTERDITERKRAEEAIQRHVEQLTALKEIDQAISSSLELKEVLDVLLEKLEGLPHVDGASVMVLKPGATELDTVAVRGLSEEFARTTEDRLRDDLPHLVVEQGKPLVVTDLAEDDRVAYRDLCVREGLASYIGFALLAKGKLIGVLGIYSKERYGWSQDQTDFLHALVGQAAIALEKAHAYKRLEEQNLQAVVALVSAVEARDPYTSGHSHEVTKHAVAIAKKLGLPEKEIEGLRWAGLLHDVGKIGVSDAVLSKPGRLTAAEYMMIKAHPIISADIVGKIEGLTHLVPIIRHHHEWYDGNGYPDGLKGEEIPLGARILAVADGFDAMKAERPYRTAKSREEALAEVKAGAGTQWDPKVVKAFLAVTKKGSKTP